MTSPCIPTAASVLGTFLFTVHMVHKVDTLQRAAYNTIYLNTFA
jgi:hypothetical protein